ncbi:MAG: sigma-54-dependent Fis family transcriptional regulator [Halieaceae bacterium]|nr:sigma-54-dependent Fis family transcriptional regulator [Halieaceae bacterium]
MKTLIVEDSTTLCAIYSQYLDGSGLEVTSVESLAAARDALVEHAPQLVLLDIELPDGSGLDLIDDVQRLHPRPAVVVMTGHGAGYAEQAISSGADDFLTKPFDAARLRVTLLNAADKLKLSQRVASLSERRDHLGPLHGASPTMQSVYHTLESLAGTDAPAFVMGESGTGKELAARAIHQFSARAPEPFVIVDCSTLQADLLEQTLFGNEGGGGLVPEAASGTLFLDEVCSLSFSAQSTLLRLIQHGTYRPVGSSQEVAADVRIIASTNRDPLFEMREGRLREDLYYRLYVVPLRMPPLRERSDDVVLLASQFLARFSEEEGRPARHLSESAAEALRQYSWPGNVRQLENAMRQLLLLETSADVDESTIYRIISGTEMAVDNVTPAAVSDDSGSPPGNGGIEPLWITEKKAIEAAIEACDGSINRAAKQLEVAPSTIYRKIQSWKPQTSSH